MITSHSVIQSAHVLPVDAAHVGRRATLAGKFVVYNHDYDAGSDDVGAIRKTESNDHFSRKLEGRDTACGRERRLTCISQMSAPAALLALAE